MFRIRPDLNLKKDPEDHYLFVRNQNTILLTFMFKSGGMCSVALLILYPAKLTTNFSLYRTEFLGIILENFWVLKLVL